MLETPTEEVARLRGCLNDLVGIMALPALWAGGEPQQIVGTLLDALLGMLQLAFVFVRLNDPDAGPSIEMIRGSELLESTHPAREFGLRLDASLGNAPLKWPPTARVSIGNEEFCLASARLSAKGEIGIVLALLVSLQIAPNHVFFDGIVALKPEHPVGDAAYVRHHAQCA